MNLEQAKHAFITGGANGIGLAIANALAERGVKVTIADIDEQALDLVVASRPGMFRRQLLDTRDREGWADAKESAEREFGPVDILVNNAGIAPDGREFADMDPASFDRIVGINLNGVFNGVSTFAASMRKRGCGHIVNTSSLAGLGYNPPGLGAYAVSKFGVVAMSEVLRIELAPYGVGVSVLCPGLVATNLPQSTQKVGGQLRAGSEGVAMSGMSPGEVADLVITGIEANDPYIITHPEHWRGVEKRHEAIRAAFFPE